MLSTTRASQSSADSSLKRLWFIIGLLDYEVPSQGDRADSQTSKAMAQELLAREPWYRRMKAAAQAREAKQTPVPF